MNKHYRSLFPALAVMASLCWQIPVSAQSSEHRGVAAPQAAQRYNRPPGPVPTYSNNSNGGASRYPRYPGSGPGPGPAPGYPGRYPSHPVYPGYPYARYPVYPGYSVYPRYPAYYPYPVYPHYYGYYGVAVYPSYYPAPVPVPVPVPAPYGYGPVGAPGCGGAAPALGVAGAVTGALVGNNNSAPRNRGVGTVVGALAGGIIGSAVGGAIDNSNCYPR